MKRIPVSTKKLSALSLCFAVVLSLCISVSTSSANSCTTYITSDFCDPTDWIYMGSSPGFVRCDDPDTLLISRCNHTIFPLPTPIQGIVEFTSLVKPTGDYNTNFSIRLGYSQTSMDAVFLGMNETNRWVYHDENGGEHWIGPYSGTWTKVRILIDTDANKWSLWLDDSLIATDIGTDFDVTAGIDWFQLHSGRSEAPHPSYLKEIELDNCLTPPTVITVDIDVQPGDPVGCLNINGHGVIPVAILGNADFDVYQIDVNTLSFAGLALNVVGKDKLQYAYKDVNGDGYMDMICQFEDDPSTWTPGEGIATLTGNLLDGTPIEGSDEICVIEQ